MFYGLTPLGIFHTAVSFVALFAGFLSIARFKRITPRTMSGAIYIYATLVVCVTGFGIFQHGGFGKAHTLGIATLATLAIAGAADRFRAFGSASPYVETVGYSLTLFFHMIPTLTEGATRLPYGAPLASNPEAPEIQAAIGILFVVFVLGATCQVVRIRRNLATLTFQSPA